MNPFTQKAIFLWNVPQVEGGNAQKIADRLKSAGFGAVWVKVADGSSVFKSWNILVYGDNVTRAFVDTMHANGIAVAGWGFCYGYGDGEGKIAAQQVGALDLDGYIFDIESKFEYHDNRVALAGQMIGTYEKNVSKHVPLGICSWAFFQSRVTGSQIHPSDHIKFLLGFADYGIPMIYWNRTDALGKPVVMTSDQVMSYTRDSLRQWGIITDKPIIPAGRAYTGDGNVVIPENVITFGIEATACVGVSFWSMEHAIKIPDVWDALKMLTFGEPTEPEPPTPDIPFVKLVSISPQPTTATTVTVSAEGITYTLTYTPPIVVPEPPVVTPDFPHKYLILDDIAGGREVRHGLPSTIRYRGGKGTVNLLNYPEWLKYIYSIQGNPNYQFISRYTFAPRIGWSNAGGYVVEQVDFSGNIVEVTRIEGTKYFIKSVCVADPIPRDKDGAIVYVRPVAVNDQGTHPLIHNFSIQYHDHLDLTTDGKYARTIVFSNIDPATGKPEELYIDSSEYKLKRL